MDSAIDYADKAAGVAEMSVPPQDQQLTTTSHVAATTAEGWQLQRRKMDNEVVSLEKLLSSHGALTQVKDYQLDARAMRKSTAIFLSHVRNRLSSLKDSMQILNKQLNDASSSSKRQNNSKEALRSILESFENQLSTVKYHFHSEYEALNMEEEQLSKEMESFTSKVSSWEEQESISFAKVEAADEPQSGVSALKKKQAADRLKRDLERQTKIGALDAQIATLGGRSGGWDYRDHDVFIRAWTQAACAPEEVEFVLQDLEIDGFLHRSLVSQQTKEPVTNVYLKLPRPQKIVVMRKLRPMLPGKSEEEVEDHINWYLAHLALIGEKKWLLSTWKDEKKSESGKKNNASELTAAAETAAQEQTQKWARTEDERMATKQRLAKWREERDEAVRMQHEAKKSEEERTRRLQEERSADRRRENRVRLEAWREIERSHKENMAAADEAMSAAKRATSVDPAEIRRRRARDKKIALERQKKVSQYQKELAPRAEKISQIEITPEVIAYRDPNRLLELTKASQAQKLTDIDLDLAERRRTEAGAHARRIPFSGRDLQFGGRTKPAWCKPMV